MAVLGQPAGRLGESTSLAATEIIQRTPPFLRTRRQSPNARDEADEPLVKRAALARTIYIVADNLAAASVFFPRRLDAVEIPKASFGIFTRIQRFRWPTIHNSECRHGAVDWVRISRSAESKVRQSDGWRHRALRVRAGVSKYSSPLRPT